MLVTLTGAYKNAGDHLIGWRAQQLLRRHVDDEVVNVDRRSIAPEHYELFNRARAVLLTGGPAYQKNLYPTIYPLELEKIRVPVIPYGLGWRDKLGKQPEEFEFESAAAKFLGQIHADSSRFSSARCPLTVRLLNTYRVNNVEMTGCPAWYDETKLDLDYTHPARIRTVVVTLPDRIQPEDTQRFLAYVRRQFLTAKIILLFQAGIKSSLAIQGEKMTRWNKKIAVAGALLGMQIRDVGADREQLTALLDTADLHIGYRVHSHIYCVSQRKASILIAEDARAVGQNLAMGLPQLTAKDSFETKRDALVSFLDSKGAQLQAAVESVRGTHATMLRFLQQI